jgi:hypothetical protein
MEETLRYLRDAPIKLAGSTGRQDWGASPPIDALRATVRIQLAPQDVVRFPCKNLDHSLQYILGPHLPGLDT